MQICTALLITEENTREPVTFKRLDECFRPPLAFHLMIQNLLRNMKVKICVLRSLLPACILVL